MSRFDSLRFDNFIKISLKIVEDCTAQFIKELGAPSGANEEGVLCHEADIRRMDLATCVCGLIAF